MQYILTQQEFDELEPKENFFKLEDSTDKVLYNLSKAFCPRIIKKKKYCDDCQFSKEIIIKRGSKKQACPLPKEFSK